jgi:hypothetical protein
LIAGGISDHRRAFVNRETAGRLAGPVAGSAVVRLFGSDRAASPYDFRPHQASLWWWLGRAVEVGLAVRVGKGTMTVPFRNFLVTHY